MCCVRADDGQATTDYVALLALLALLTAVAAGLAGAGAPGIVNAVVGQLRHALCVVGGGSCPIAPRLPCTLASTRDAHHIAVNLAVVRLDDDRTVLRERLSDGTVRLTVTRRDGGGAELGIGGHAKVTAWGRSLGVEGEARAGVQGVLGHGEVYDARDDRAADALLRALREGGRPAASEVFVDGGFRGLGRVAGNIGFKEIGGQLDGVGNAMLGARRDRRNGRLTISLSAGAAGSGLASLIIGGAAGVLDGQAVLGLTLDRGGRPAELTLNATGRTAAGATLPDGIAAAVQQALPPSASHTGGRRWEMGSRVDLHDPAVAAAWRAFRASPTSVAATRRLGEQLRSHATVDVRTYALSSSSSGAGAAVALGIKLGGEFDHTIDRARLLTAVRRPPWGLWEQRLDCV
jgi:hypothetical protein